jgi:hypothetical protein
MHKTARAALTALTAALLLASTVSTASARNLSVTSSNLRIGWTNIEFTNEIGVPAIRCSLTLEGSFHSRTIPKVERLLIGAITRATANACTNGRLTPRAERPWHLTYENFTGTLPAIATVGFLLSRFSFLEEIPGFCNGAYGSATDNISFTATLEGGGGLTTFTPVAGRNRWTLTTTLSGICSTRGGFVGSGTITVLNGTGRVTVRLI